TDPHINLALEEYCLRNLDPEQDYLLFYINEPSIIVGRFQNTLEEINQNYVEKKGIHVVRRISGGGAVYHDAGNLNFSFITRYAKNNLLNFKKFTEPVIRTLKTMGIDAELSGRNDILVNGKKISGNAQYATRTSMLSHGTLLFDSDMETLVRALNVSEEKIVSKALKSVRSRVINIRECMQKCAIEAREGIAHRVTDIEMLKTRLLETVFAPFGEIRTCPLSQEQWQAVYDLAATKYRSWEWNFGKSPKFNLQRKYRFLIGQVDTRIQVESGVMTAVKMYGDFLGSGDVQELETLLTGQEFRKDTLLQCLEGVELGRYFGEMEAGDFVDYLCGS
ncbi:MAG: lipoate--protein ligase, partial [Acidobacteria bacterium]